MYDKLSFEGIAFESSNILSTMPFVGNPQTVILSLSHGFMSHGFIRKKVADGQVFCFGTNF